MNVRPAKLTRGGFPLAAIFMLTAVVAVLGSQLSLINGMAKKVSVNFPLSIAVGAATGLALGCLIGLLHIRRVRGAVVGMATGLVTGGMAGPICMASIEQPWPILFASVAGGLGLIVFAALYRLINDKDPVGRSGESFSIADLQAITHENHPPETQE